MKDTVNKMQSAGLILKIKLEAESKWKRKAATPFLANRELHSRGPSLDQNQGLDQDLRSLGK
jgi:hypothetical protein